MARRRKRRHRTSQHQGVTPEDVLSGRVEPAVDALLALIHRVNPTLEEGLSSEETERRYGIKAQLQSLLVERFLAELVITADPQDENVVSITHRCREVDACHALVGALEPEARSLVRRVVDESMLETRPQPAEQPLPASSWEEESQERPVEGDPLALGREAVEAYDYDLARRHLEAALRQSGGGAEAATSLLELLVDHLGDARKALEVEGRLCSDAARDPQVRLLLALASAREDRVDAAQRLIRGLDLPRVGDVYLALARASVRACNPEAAASSLAEAERHGVAAGITGPVAEAIQRLQSTGFEGREHELEQARAAGDWEAAEGLARSILEQGYDSHVARGLLRELDARHRRERVEAHLAAAGAAEAEGDPVKAAHDLRQAVAVDPDVGAVLAERIARLEGEARARDDAERSNAVLSLLAADEIEQGLLAYLELEGRLRDRVREGAQRPEPGWLDELEPLTSSARKQAAVTAVMALERATRLLGDGRAGAAVAALEPQLKALRGIEQAGRVLSAARTRLREEECSRSADALAGAWQAAQDGDLALARELLGAVDLSLLDEPGRHRAERLDGRLGAAERQQRLEARVGALERAGDLVAARRVAAEAAADDDSWAGRVAELSTAIETAWRVHKVPGPGACALPRETSFPEEEVAPCWLTDDGRLVLVECHGVWFHMWLIQAGSGEPEQVLSLRCPEPLSNVCTVVVDRSGVTVLETGGHVLRLDAGGDVVMWTSVSDRFPSGQQGEAILLAPGTDQIWTRSRDAEVQVFPLGRHAPGRSIADVDVMQPIVGHPEHRVLVSSVGTGTRQGSTATLYLPRGSGADRQPLEVRADERLLAAVMRPDGEGTILATTARLHEAQDVAPISLGVLSAQGRLQTTLVLEGSDPDAGFTVASSSDAQRVFLVYRCGEAKLLMSFRQEGDRLVEQYCVPVSANALLVQDVRGRRVALLQSDDRESLVVPLGQDRPEVVPSPAAERLPFIGATSWCGRTRGEPGALRVALHRVLGDTPAAQRDGLGEDLVDKYGDDPDDLMAAAQALLANGFEDAARHVVSTARSRFPDAAGPRLEEATGAEEAGEWPRVLDLLGGVDACELESNRARHIHHVLGLARFGLGDLAGARETWHAGEVLDGECQIADLIALADIVLEACSAPEGVRDGTVAGLASAIRRADTAVASGAWSEVMSILDTPWVWAFQEMQSMARLAEAYLHTKDEADVLRFTKRLCLATTCDIAGNPHARPHNLPVPGCAWPPERIADVVGRAHEWLEAEA